MTLEEVVRKEITLLEARMDTLLPDNYEYNDLSLFKTILKIVLKKAGL